MKRQNQSMLEGPLFVNIIRKNERNRKKAPEH